MGRSHDRLIALTAGLPTVLYVHRTSGWPCTNFRCSQGGTTGSGDRRSGKWIRVVRPDHNTSYGTVSRPSHRVDRRSPRSTVRSSNLRLAMRELPLQPRRYHRFRRPAVGKVDRVVRPDHNTSYGTVSRPSHRVDRRSPYSTVRSSNLRLAVHELPLQPRRYHGFRRPAVGKVDRVVRPDHNTSYGTVSRPSHRVDRRSPYSTVRSSNLRLAVHELPLQPRRYHRFRRPAVGKVDRVVRPDHNTSYGTVSRPSHRVDRRSPYSTVRSSNLRLAVHELPLQPRRYHRFRRPAVGKVDRVVRPDHNTSYGTVSRPSHRVDRRSPRSTVRSSNLRLAVHELPLQPRRYHGFRRPAVGKVDRVVRPDHNTSYGTVSRPSHRVDRRSPYSTVRSSNLRLAVHELPLQPRRYHGFRRPTVGKVDRVVRPDHNTTTPLHLFTAAAHHLASDGYFQRLSNFVFAL